MTQQEAEPAGSVGSPGATGAGRTDAQRSSAEDVAAEAAATSPAGAILARLLVSTVEVVADFELIYEQPAVVRAVGQAAHALTTLSEERPEELGEALDVLSAIVAALPPRRVDTDLSGWGQ